MKREILIFIVLASIIMGPAFPCKNAFHDDELIVDQKQLLYDRKLAIHYGVWAAQSFKPSMTPLAKVLLKIEKKVVIDAPLELSIRKELNGPDLVYIALVGAQVPYHIWWVEFDFSDIEVEVDETYYIVVRSITPSGKSFYWLYKQNLTEEGDPYERGKQFLSVDSGLTWAPTETEGFYVDSTFQTLSYAPHPDLECHGVLNWTDIKPGSTVTGSFIVENVGSPLSYLNWKIELWPYWGVWTFSPKNQSRLTPEDGPTTVLVTVRAPNVTFAEYAGQVKIVNLEDSTDYSIIPVTLTTSRRHILFYIIDKILEFFPNLERLFY